MKKILVIEDDESTRDILKCLLNNPAYKIFSTATASKAFKIFQDEKIDIVLLNLNLPDMHGLEILKIIKGDKNTRDIEVVITSMITNLDIIRRCLEEGAFWFISKSSELFLASEFLVRRVVSYQDMKRLAVPLQSPVSLLSDG